MKYCKKHDILKEYLEKHETEVINMLYTEWNIDEAIEVAREEAFEDGREEGCKEIARNALTEGSTPDFIHKITGLSLEEIEKLRDNG